MVSAAIASLALGIVRPNIVFILTDDQRFDAAGYAGHPIVRTPNLDALAAKGARFRNAFATTPICAASRASILTGKYERTHRYTFGTPPLAPDLCGTSYPSLLKKAGYRTALFGKVGVNFPPGESSKMFDALMGFGYPYLRKQLDGTTRHIDQLATDKALEFLDSQPKDQPFCLSISFNSPHAQDGQLDDLYPAPSTVEGMYSSTPIPPPPLGEDRYFEALPEFLQKAIGRTRWYWQFDTPEKYAKNIRSYYRMISGLDVEVGRVLDKLKELGVQRNTVVLFASDNGYFLGERGLSGKWVHFEESLRVPMLVFDPRIEGPGRDVSQIALNVDLTATLLDLAGVSVPKSVQGVSLMGLVRGKKSPARKDFFCEHLMVDPAIPQWEGVHGDRYVYAKYFGQNPPFEFLHDLRSDPKETENLAPKPEFSAALAYSRKRLKELKAAYGGEYKK